MVKHTSRRCRKLAKVISLYRWCPPRCLKIAGWATKIRKGTIGHRMIMICMLLTAHPPSTSPAVWGPWRPIDGCPISYLRWSIRMKPEIPSPWHLRREAWIYSPVGFITIHWVIPADSSRFCSMWPSGHTTKSTRLSYFYMLTCKCDGHNILFYDSGFLVYDHLVASVINRDASRIKQQN